MKPLPAKAPQEKGASESSESTSNILSELSEIDYSLRIRDEQTGQFVPNDIYLLLGKEGIRNYSAMVSSLYQEMEEEKPNYLEIVQNRLAELDEYDEKYYKELVKEINEEDDERNKRERLRLLARRVFMHPSIFNSYDSPSKEEIRDVKATARAGQ